MCMVRFAYFQAYAPVRLICVIQGPCCADDLAQLCSCPSGSAWPINACFSACRRFCFLCIVKWSETENKCPFCKVRFTCISKKRLDPGQQDAEEDASNGTLVQLAGQVMETRDVQDKTQTWQPDDSTVAFLEGLLCQMCGTGDDEEHLMICDRKPAWLKLILIRV